MTQEITIYQKIIDNIIFTRIDVSEFKDGKLKRFERTYSPSIMYGFETNGWNKINKEFNVIKETKMNEKTFKTNFQ